MKTLSAYLEEQGITQTAFAERLKVSRSYMSEIVSGVRTPRLELALKIHAETAGNVDLATLVAVKPNGSPDNEAAA